MISICTQVEINASQQAVWETLVESQTREVAQREIQQSNVRAASNESMPLIGNIVKWEEGNALTVQMQSKPILRALTMECTLQSLGSERTLANMSLQLDTPLGCLVTPIYQYVVKDLANTEVKKLAAGLKRDSELQPSKDQSLDDSTLPIAAVQIIDCKTLTADN